MDYSPVNFGSSILNDGPYASVNQREQLPQGGGFDYGILSMQQQQQQQQSSPSHHQPQQHQWQHQQPSQYQMMQGQTQAQYQSQPTSVLPPQYRPRPHEMQLHPSEIEEMRKERERKERERQMQLRNLLTKPHVLFYSKQCGHCKEFFERIQHSDRYRLIFKYFCVDVRLETQRRPTLPSFIKSVPTIIVDRTVYVGKNAFEWMAKAMKDTEDEKHNYDTAELDSEPSGFIPLEMNNWSDSYELLEDSKLVSDSFFVKLDSKKRFLVEHIITPEETGENTRSISDYQQERDRDNGRQQQPPQKNQYGGGGVEFPEMRETRKIDSDYEQALAMRNADYRNNARPADIESPRQTKEDNSRDCTKAFEKLMATRQKDDKKIGRKRRT
jgi:hypothetical protein